MHNLSKLLIASLAINLILWILLGASIEKSSFPIVLQYNSHFGASLIGWWRQVFVLPIIGLIIISINYLLAWFLKSKKIKYYLISASLICQIFLLISAISIILVNS